MNEQLMYYMSVLPLFFSCSFPVAFLAALQCSQGNIISATNITSSKFKRVYGEGNMANCVKQEARTLVECLTVGSAATEAYQFNGRTCRLFTDLNDVQLSSNRFSLTFYVRTG